MGLEGIVSRKQELRERYKKAAADYNKDSKVSDKICRFLSEIIEKGINIGAFMRKDPEPDLGSFLVKADCKVFYPRIEGDDLRYYAPKHAYAFLPNSSGVSEPKPEESEPISVDQLKVIFVPGLAFDKKGWRLGRGKGFYDRLLKNFKGLKVGVGSVAQFAKEDLPVEVHDCRMDMIVTDNFVFRPWPS